MSPIEYYESIVGLLYIYPLFFVIFYILSRVGKKYYGRYINGLVSINISTAILFTISIDIYFRIGTVTLYNFLFIIFVEIIVYYIINFFYIKLILIARNIDDKKFIISYKKNAYFIYAITLLEIIVQLLNVSWDGSSRIEYQTQMWYSPFRILFTFITPVVYFSTYVFLKNKIYTIPIINVSILIIISIGSGSKSGFIITIFAVYFFYRDIFGSINISKLKIIAAIAPVIVIAIYNLAALGVDAKKMGQRISDYAEATTMLISEADPTEICVNLSVISKIHRGFGRLFGDEDSLTTNKLFGFALSDKYYGLTPDGSSSLTGPNARIGAYALCNFDSYLVIILLLFYLFATKFVFFIISISKIFKPVYQIAVIIFAFHFLQNLELDYNTAMSDLTGFIIIYFLINFYKLLRINRNLNI